MLPGWGDVASRRGRARPAAPSTCCATSSSNVEKRDDTQWTVVGGRNASRPAKTAALVPVKHDLSAPLPLPRLVLARALEEVGRDRVVGDVVSQLSQWSAPGVCRALLLGLGSPSSSATARHQLALALLLVAALPKLPPAPGPDTTPEAVCLFAFDPVFDAADCALLLHHGCTLLTEEEALAVRLVSRVFSARS